MSDQAKNLLGDRISNLPEELLLRILSNLPTKEAIRTEILSTRWMTVWSHLSTLNLDYDDYYDDDDYDGDDLDEDEDRKELFRKFVDRTLLDHKMPYLRDVLIDCPQFNRRVIKLWISAVIQRNIYSLTLSVSSSEPILVLHQSFFSGCSLVHLKLYMRAVLNFPDVSPDWFPNLKVLELSLVRFKDNDSATNLISSCPVLEDLDIITDDEYSFRTLNVSAPCLKTFSLYYSLSCQNLEFDYVPKIFINTPALEHIKITDYVPHMYEVKDSSSLVKAEIHLWDFMSPFSDNYIALRLFELLHNISTVKSLSIAPWTIRALLGVDARVLPTFPNLTTLELKRCCSRIWNWKLVIAVLKSCPVLEVLIIHDCAFRHPRRFRDRCYDVPSCLKSHLKTIEICGSSKGYELDDIKYFLESANVLEKMILKGFNKESQQILSLPRASPTCRIIIQ